MELTDFQREIVLMLDEMKAKCDTLSVQLEKAREKLEEQRRKRSLLEETLRIYRETHNLPPKEIES